MNRRELIRYTALATGAAVCSPLLSALLSGCTTHVDDSVAYTPIFFSKEDFNLVEELVDVILPKTDSPAASEVGVHKTIDLLAGTVYREKEKENFRKQVDALLKFLKESHLDELDEKERLALLQNISESSAYDVRAGLLSVRQQAVAFYLSAQEIATGYLNYLPVPGKYEACIPVEETGNKAWAI